MNNEKEYRRMMFVTETKIEKMIMDEENSRNQD